MGRLMALSMAQENYSVEVFERGDETAKAAAAYAAAAMLAPLAESAITELSVVKMGKYSIDRWKSITQGLAKKVFFQQNGTLILWHRQDSAEAKRFSGLLAKTSREMPELPAAQFVEGSEIRHLEPEIGPQFSQSLYLPEEGQLDNRELLEALLAEAQSLGVIFHWSCVREIEDFSNGSQSWLIDCRGIGAKTSFDDLRGVRGEVIRIHAPEVNLSRPVRLIHPRYPIYIAPKENNLFVIGATEIESEDLSPISVRSTLELLSAAYTVHSGFAEARLLEATTQCRPTLKDNMPLIEQSHPGVLKINGLYRHGFMISPAVMDAALEIVLQGKSQIADKLQIRYINKS